MTASRPLGDVVNRSDIHVRMESAYIRDKYIYIYETKGTRSNTTTNKVEGNSSFDVKIVENMRVHEKAQTDTWGGGRGRESG